jgi:TPR repeat protein
MYANGQGVTQDNAKALHWLRKSAEQGNVDAQFSMGWVYENGQGVTQSCVVALQWYRKAAALNHDRAQQSLTRLTNAKS